MNGVFRQLCALFGCLGTAVLFLVAGAAQAQENARIKLELNKLEAIDDGCRAYLVIENTGDDEYESLRLDLVLFQPDGIIGRRFAVQLAPVKPKKRSVKLFDLSGLTCDRAGSLLINDAPECKTAGGPIEDCVSRIEVSSRSNVQLMK